MFLKTIERHNGVSIPLQVHPSRTNRVVLSMPGFNGTIDGYNDKYKKMARHYSTKGFCAFVQMPNITRDAGFTYGTGLIADLSATMEWMLANHTRLGVEPSAELCLMGASAGGFAVAHAAAHNPRVKKILLLEPTLSHELMGAFDFGLLSRFEGECNIVVASEGIGKPAGVVYKRMLNKASSVRVVEIPNCNHQFAGTVNGKIFSKAPAWAFGDDLTFPSPEGGLELY